MSNRLFFSGITLFLALYGHLAMAVQYRAAVINDEFATEINAVNSSGVAVGQTTSSDGQIQPVKWVNGQPVLLGLLGCPYLNPHACSGTANDINDKGTIVGKVHSSANYYLGAFILDNTMRLIRNVGDEWSVAMGVNASDYIAGYGRATYVDYNYLTQGFFYMNDNNVTRITSDATRESFAHDLNDQNNVVGCADMGNGKHAFFWSAATSQMQDLNTLGGASSCAFAVNNSNMVVGNADTQHGKPHAFLWTDTTGMQDLGSLGDRGRSFANDISPDGTIVGHYEQSYRRFWTQTRGFVVVNGVMQDLTSLLLPGQGNIIIEKATAISSNNIIAASGTIGGKKTMMTLHPVP